MTMLLQRTWSHNLLTTKKQCRRAKCQGGPFELAGLSPFSSLNLPESMDGELDVAS